MSGPKGSNFADSIRFPNELFLSEFQEFHQLSLMYELEFQNVAKKPEYTHTKKEREEGIEIFSSQRQFLHAFFLFCLSLVVSCSKESMSYDAKQQVCKLIQGCRNQGAMTPTDFQSNQKKTCSIKKPKYICIIIKQV